MKLNINLNRKLSIYSIDVEVESMNTQVEMKLSTHKNRKSIKKEVAI